MTVKHMNNFNTSHRRSYQHYFDSTFKNPRSLAWLPPKTKNHEQHLHKIRRMMYGAGKLNGLISFIDRTPVPDELEFEKLDQLKSLWTYLNEMDSARQKILAVMFKAVNAFKYMGKDQARKEAKAVFPPYFSNLFFYTQKDRSDFDEALRRFVANENPELLTLHLDTLFAVEEIINRYIPKFVMMVGVAGAGKSTASEDYIEQAKDTPLETVLISSDEIRKHHNIPSGNRESHKFVFEQMKLETIKALEENKNVIYDATNIHRDKRMKLLEELPEGVHKIALYLATPYEILVSQNRGRENPIPEYVIDNMYRNMQIPVKEEGWDKVVIEHHDTTVEEELHEQYTKAIRAEVLFNRDGYDLISFLAQSFIEFTRIYDMPHDAVNHNLSVSRHAYHTYRTILDSYKADEVSIEKEIMLWTALCLNLGKHFAKDFADAKGNQKTFAKYRGYENISSQLVIPFLYKMNLDEDVVAEVSKLIQFYQLVKRPRKSSKEKLVAFLGEETYEKLIILRRASRENKVDKNRKVVQEVGNEDSSHI